MRSRKKEGGEVYPEEERRRDDLQLPHSAQNPSTAKLFMEFRLTTKSSY
ncbi:MAG: hypothetical protein JXR53_04790 [Bacteroidales bacterium]|nr:hypothetical protein [Bacteroidales bacterium]